jgi:hypothetical protein
LTVKGLWRRLKRCYFCFDFLLLIICLIRCLVSAICVGIDNPLLIFGLCENRSVQSRNYLSNNKSESSESESLLSSNINDFMENGPNCIRTRGESACMRNGVNL